MQLTTFTLPGIPEITSGCDLAAMITNAAENSQHPLINGDILVVAQKIVSKAEDCRLDISTLNPSAEASKLATTTGKDPQLVEAILQQSQRVIRATEGVLIVKTHHGFVCANAGIDHSNTGGPENEVLLLPTDPDASARRLRSALKQQLSLTLGVIISDSFGRAWRTGQCEVAVGCAGVTPSTDLRGSSDSDGRPLEATEIANADQVAACADLARSKTSREPVVVVRGLTQLVTEKDGLGASSLIRPTDQDLFL